MITSAALVERADVVIVGARLAGCAAASAFARYGRRVVVLDRAGFPSDTISTHFLFPTGVDELRRMGALDGILARDPSKMRSLRFAVGDAVAHEPWRPIGDIDYAVCVPRDIQDAELVAAARARGADVRERCAVRGVIIEQGRAVGVRYSERGGAVREIRAKLVVGADGRRSTVAAAVGAYEPYRISRNGRGLVFRYLDDPRAGTPDAEVAYQWRDENSVAFGFPCTPRGRILILFMGPRDEVREAKMDTEAYWERKLRQHPGCADRIAGATNLSAVRMTADTCSYFRRSSGPGWALIGDAAHFKDPVIGQGMRDAMWMGRTLAERALGVLDEPAALDRTTRAWERNRDRECLPLYHFANFETAIPSIPIPVLAAAAEHFATASTQDMTDMFQRIRTPQRVLSIPTLVAIGARSITPVKGQRAPAKGQRAHLLRTSVRILRTELGVRADLALARVYRGRMRGLGKHAGENPGATLVTAPRVVEQTVPAHEPARAAR